METDLHVRRATSRAGSPLIAEASGATLASSIANLTNTNVGVGMLAMPAALASAGWVGGLSLLAFAALASAFASSLLVDCVDHVGRPATLSCITSAAFGPLGRALVDVAVASFCASCAIGYLIVAGDSLPDVVRALDDSALPDESLWLRRETWIVGSALVVVAPLSCMRDIDSLRFASFLVLVCAVAIGATVLLFSAGAAGFDAHEGCEAGNSRCLGHRVSVTSAGRTLSALTTFAFAFASQPNVVAVSSELRSPTRARMLGVIAGSVCLSATIFGLLAPRSTHAGKKETRAAHPPAARTGILASAGYYTFGDAVCSDLLLSYPETPLLSLARLALTYVVLLSYPVVSYPVPYCCDSLLHLLSRGACGVGSSRASRELIAETWRRYGRDVAEISPRCGGNRQTRSKQCQGPRTEREL